MKKRVKVLVIFFTVLVIGQTNSSTGSMMYWTDLANNKIQRANLDGSGISDLITTGLGNPQFIALDAAAGKMYWTDSGLETIKRANLNGSHIETLVTTGLISPKGISLDVGAGKMYWTDALTHKIQRANLNGSGVEDLVTTGLQWPNGIALDITGGKMYWTDGGTAKIQRANLDGSGVEDLFNSGSSALQDIALDVSKEKMYWTDLVKIQRANLDGTNIEFLVTTGGRLRGIALDVAAGKMYWTDTLWYGKIQCANMDGSGVKDLIVGGMNFPQGLALDVPKPPKIIYVDADAGGANNGLRWADAYNNLQDALTVASSGDEIRVAQGIYKPAPPPPLPPPGTPLPPFDRAATFQLINGVTIKGGYAGFGEADPNAWDIDAYETILSGDLAGDDVAVSEPCDLWDELSRSENSYHVVTASGTDGTAVLDGFTITGGSANSHWSSGHDSGGGIYINFGSPTVINCTFKGNSAGHGGGLDGSHSNLTMINCTFTKNYADSQGGGMKNGVGSPTVHNCTFSENRSRGYGGGMFNSDSNTVLYNCIFRNNSGYQGGALSNIGSAGQMVINCVLSGNSAVRGGAIYNYESDLIITDCIVNGNRARWSGGGIDIWVGIYSPPGPCYMERNCNVTLTNCTFSGNQAEDGKALSCGSCDDLFPSKVKIENCILWDGGDEIRNYDDSTITITYSDVWDGFPGEGNIYSIPLFFEPGYWGNREDPNIVVEPNDPNAIWVNGDYHLLSGSPCIDAGDPNYVPEPNETDLDVRPRVIGDRIDMGAYEFFNTRPVGDAGDNQIVECACNTADGTKVTLDGSGSYDVDGDAITYRWTGPFIESPADGATPTVTLEDGCPGEYVVALVVNDGMEDSEPNEVVITVEDTTPPEFTFSVSPTMLWPPNKKMVKITPSWTVSDDCDTSPGVSLVSVSMNESETGGKGHTDDDIQIGEDGTIYVRAKRNRTGDRIYTITYQAVDDSGNAAVGSATVSVPRKRR